MAKKSSRNAIPRNNVHMLYGTAPEDGVPLRRRAGGKMSAQRYVRNLRPKTDAQAVLLDALETANLVLAIGPAGTGKTFLAVAKGIELLDAGRVERIVLSRPAMEAGDSIGYLPGSLQEKMSPYLRPLLDALTDRMGTKRVNALMSDGTIEVAPVGYMRGRTLNNAYIVIDEAQNCTYAQIKMLVTRLGWNSTMVLTGDPEQSDLLPGISGLSEISSRLETLSEVSVVRLGRGDVVRHPLVSRILGVV